MAFGKSLLICFFTQLLCLKHDQAVVGEVSFTFFRNFSVLYCNWLRVGEDTMMVTILSRVLPLVYSASSVSASIFLRFAAA